MGAATIDFKIPTPVFHNTKKCGYKWFYKGNSLWATCPGCDLKIPIAKFKVELKH